MSNSNKIINTILLLTLAISLFFINNYWHDTQREQLYMSANNETLPPQKLFLESWKIIKNNYYDPSLNHQNWYYWRNHYSKHIKTKEDAYIAINSMISSLDDPYSRFLTSEEMTEQTIDLDSKITGIGVSILTISGKFLVVGVIENSPAQNGGIKAGDTILKVNEEDVKGKNIADIAKAIRGPINSFVKLELLRDDKKITKKLQRKEVKIQTVRAKMLKNHIGYIKINNFMSKNLPREFVEALKKIQTANGIIIDLRNNPGGVLDNAIILTNTFLSNGTIVKIKNRQQQKYSIVADENSPHLTLPVVILINQGSASASEILSGALKDNNRAVLVGEKTYGKGMIQKVYNLPNKTGMNITVAKYLTPSGADINKHGIEPHYKVENPQTYSQNDDEQLKKAITILNEIAIENKINENGETISKNQF